MFRKLVRTAPMAVALVLAMLVPASGLLAQTTGGNLEGRATQETNALPGVTVTATNTATGLTRTGVTDANGGYRFAVLPAGTYKVTFSLSGFSDLAIEQADVNIGSTTVVDASMKVAAVEETITVTAEAPLIATTPSIGTVVSQNELENLPLNGRQFANVAVLAPGTGLSYNSDPTKPGQLTVLLNGGNGRNLNFTVDGGDNTDDTIGGALQNFNLDAVQEFNIQTSQY
ncbi:MAG TPA: carboxypeptidase-like regulatory domain-containing protein, partial [Thermoanaerobaculia bacterium]|nr:carboxypeptidase-like regulatory domain-containing protein [Thermoanaerobaculia bacterium]